VLPQPLTLASQDAMTNQTIFKVDGKALSLSGRKDVLDASGTKLFQVRKKHIAIHTTYQGISANDEVLFTVSSRMSLGTKLEIKVCADGERCEVCTETHSPAVQERGRRRRRD
jgi:uncharacterized protein YxjI